MLDVPLYRLQCGANSYDWGKLGSDSAAARFAAATKFEIEEEQPYSELWMGTHPSNPSKEFSTGRPLHFLIETNHALVGSSVASKYGNNLPFLFKVLSIRKALSIQAHPDKKLAERLHAEDPKYYPDDNHKPEMAIALTDFDGFCGFRQLEEIVVFLKGLQPLRDLIGDEAAQAFISAVEGRELSTKDDDLARNKGALKQLYTSIMTVPDDHLKKTCGALVDLARTKPESFPGGGGVDGKGLAELVLRLNQQFPDDIGIFCTFVLNYIRLKPGEAMFLRANEPHAYLSGDIMECMASSDNVVRAGFTPKYKDVKNLVAMLTYTYCPPQSLIMCPIPYPNTSHTLLYDPPIEEFSVMRTDLRKGEKEVVPGVEGPSILIVTKGGGRLSVGDKKSEELKEGWVFFVGATAETVLEGGEEGCVVYRAFCEVKA
ncbi:mannose-6-phosphate isomerase [Kalaharituber pfeilii]|nr:mannose-6-phosphate isomerase [Kalaharituber pfeilii]